MSSLLTLPTTPFEHPAMDYAFLRRAGIRHLERLAGRLWTDFNTHDPGITILEQVCYALTDLAYRINYPLPDLLADDAGQAGGGLFSPAQILTTDPVTLTDMRKLVIDVEGVRNAWVEPLPAQEIPLFYDRAGKELRSDGDPVVDEQIHLKGLYRVLFEPDGRQSGDVRQRAARRLHAHRLLGEDFVEIKSLNAQFVDVEARLEIGAVDDAGAVLLNVFQRLADHISPSVRFYTLQERLEAGKRIDEIFDGPWLEHGFIDPDELEQAQHRANLRTSDLIQVMMDAPGVKAVRTISLSAGGVRRPWLLALDSNQAPRFDAAGSRIVLERNGLPVPLDLTALVTIHNQRQLTSTAYRQLAPAERDVAPPTGRDRRVSRYTSIQHQFPATYGLGTAGLPQSASPRRKAQARQLKTYLLFFDQLLANYFAQLSRVKDLFSFSGESAQTYFTQAIDDPDLGLAGLRKADHAARLQAISNETEGAFASAGRRNRFLNHLLARFAEQFTDYALLLYGAQADQSKLIREKRAFLQNYPELSQSRGAAYNDLQPFSQANRSGLEKRIRHKLGLPDSPDEDFILVEHILLRPMAGDKRETTSILAGDGEETAPILTGASYPDPYSLRLSFVFPDLTESSAYAAEDFRKFVERTVREETPAHLSVDIQWMEPDKMQVFRAAYEAWLDKRRAYYWAALNFTQENIDDIR